MVRRQPALVAELGELVRRGIKQASAGLVASWEAEGDPLPRVGDVRVVIDWSGAPLAVIEITDVRVQPFEAVDAAFARDEGEGDGTLAWWREAHRRYFGRECARRSASRYPSCAGASGCCRPCRPAEAGALPHRAASMGRSVRLPHSDHERS